MSEFQHHLIDCLEGQPDEYTGGWCDVDHLMLYALFALLCRFVDREDGLEMLECQYMSEHAASENREERKKTYDEVKALHEWWLERRKTRGGLWPNPQYEKDSEMMKRLIDIRACLWT